MLRDFRFAVRLIRNIQCIMDKPKDLPIDARTIRVRIDPIGNRVQFRKKQARRKERT